MSSQRIIAAIDDVFFMAKVRDAATAAGLDTEFGKSREDTVERTRRPGCLLAVVDLNAAKLEPIELVRELKAEGKTVLCFLAHVETEMRERATKAGADRVLARSALSQNINQILKSYLSQAL